MKRKTAVEKLSIVCVCILGFFFISIMVRFLTRQIFVEKLHWNNTFTHFIFFDNAVMNVEYDAAGEQQTIVAIDWEERYPFKHNKQIQPVEKSFEVQWIEKYKESVESIKMKAEDYAEDFLIGRIKMVNAARSYNRLIGSPAMAVNTVDEVIYLDNGYLTYAESLVEEEQIGEIADRLSSLHDGLEEKDVPFVYMNVGSKVCPYDRKLPKGAEEYTNENGDHLIAALEERDVETLDFREYMMSDGLDWYSSYYITDHHWKTKTGLWAAGIVAEYLNQNCGFEFDKKYFEENAYDIKVVQDYFLGGQGRVITFEGVEAEPYECILPKFDTLFSVKIPSRGLETMGTYRETLFDEETFGKIADYTEEEFLSKPDAYNAVTIRNDALAQIRNHNPENNQGKKILVLQDSFGWYSTTFLACDVEKIDIIYPMAFNGSVQSYVEETKPDAVVMMMCERNIPTIDFRTD